MRNNYLRRPRRHREQPKMDMAGGIVGEIKRHPYTSLSALGSFLVLSIAGPMFWSSKASASDVDKLARQITEVRETVRRESAQTELNNVRRELFDITLRISTLEREHIEVDPLLYRRRDDLQGQQRVLEARLQTMDRDDER